MKIAILADIHGNLPALEAVMADLAKESPDCVYLLGDLVNRCPWSNEVVAIVRGQPWQVIYGNHDLILSRLHEIGPDSIFNNRAQFADVWWTWERMRADDLRYLRELPAELKVHPAGMPSIRLVHGVPGDPFVGFEPGASAANVARAGDTQEALIVAGHTHRPMWEKAGRWQIFNPGGVGISHHGDARAHYGLLVAEGGVWRPIVRQVDYSLAAVEAGYHSTGFLAEMGAIGQLHLRSVLTGQAWVSDFHFWMRDQPAHLHEDIERAVALYLDIYSDEAQWAFQVAADTQNNTKEVRS